MKMNRKEQLLQEFKLRRLIRKALKIKEVKQKQKNLEENKLRHIIKHLLNEGDVDSDTQPAPYESTALSALADAFEQILPVLKTGLRKLRKPEERQSYRAHVLQKFDSMFENFEGLDAKQKIGESDVGLTEQEDDDITLKIDNRPDTSMVVPSFEKDRFKPKEEPKLEPDDADVESLAISTEDPTGARFAFSTINNSNIEKLLSDKRKLLPSDEYRKEFKEYALYNVDLWLLTYEKELADELGAAPAFSETTMPKPSGAQVSGQAQEFQGAEDDLEDLEDLEGLEGLEDLEFEAEGGDEGLDVPTLGEHGDSDFISEMEQILMMENFNVGE